MKYGIHSLAFFKKLIVYFDTYNRIDIDDSTLRFE